ncbi:MAG: hypothetical protein II707_02890 [Spirochaetales bacterium]|jgi:hypothetical protein|nr:hypothetical protein [Spirochaetales bacterium]
MKKLEIIANRAVKEDLFDRFRQFDAHPHYTMIPIVHGEGSSSPKMGDSVWPEENFMLIIYCDEALAEKIIKAVKDLKLDFPDEGIKMFEIDVMGSV